VLILAYPRLSLLVSAYSCLFPLVCAHSVICSFNLHVASVCTHLCPLSWVSVCADPRYPVALVWPSFGLCSCLFVPACLCALVCESPLPCYTHLAFIWACLCPFVLFWALVGLSVCFPASCICLYQIHN
jgi:hypothetical protein